MKFLIMLLSAISFLSCYHSEPRVQKINNPDSLAYQPLAELPKIHDSAALSPYNVEFNTLPVFTSFDALKKNINIDSSQSDSWECGSPYDFLDSTWMKEKYGDYNETKGTFENFDGYILSLYSGNVVYTSNTHLTVFNDAEMKGNTFKVKSSNIILDENTTIGDFRRLFPKAQEEPATEVGDIRFRLSVAPDFDDAFLFVFSKGKLTYINLWWLLC